MLFKVTNKTTKRSTYVGVLEFSANEGFVVLPFWVQEQLGCKVNQLVTVESATLPVGTFVKFRPREKAFIQLTDPKVILETLLRKFSCLTTGDTLFLKYSGKQFLIDVVEVRAGKKCNAISIVEADLEVDFDKPLDMSPSPTTTAVDPNIFDKKYSTSSSSASSASATAIPGPAAAPAISAEEAAWKEILKAKLKKNKEAVKKEGKGEEEEKKPSYVPFAGAGRSLIGGEKQSKSSFFGSSSSSSSPSTSIKKEEEKPKKEEDKSSFKPFAGPGRSLK